MTAEKNPLGEKLDPFKKALIESIERVLPSDEFLSITQIDMFDNGNEAIEVGITWMKG